MCGMEAEAVKVIRGDPCRRNLALQVLHLEKGDTAHIIQRTVEEVSQFHVLEGITGGFPLRMIVVCLTIDHANRVFETLRRRQLGGLLTCKYHSKMEEEELQLSVEQWEKGNENGSAVMICTDGFSTGTDVPNVRLVLFVGGSRSLIDFWQAAGRGGRDGCVAQIVVLYNRKNLIGCMGEREVNFGNVLGNFMEWAESEISCRRKTIEEFLGGRQRYATCLETNQRTGSKEIQLCDVCDRQNAEGVCTTGTRTRGEGDRSVGEEGQSGSKRRKLEVERSFDSVIDRMRSVGKFFLRENICTICVVVGKERGVHAIKRGEFCGSRHCSHVNERCLKCRQKGHRVRDCTVMKKAIERDGEACFFCFLKRVRGREIHMENEFGKRHCPFAPLTEMALAAHSDEGMRKDMAERFPVIAGRSARENVEWMLNDMRRGTAAMIFDVAEWLVTKLDITSVVRTERI